MKSIISLIKLTIKLIATIIEIMLFVHFLGPICGLILYSIMCWIGSKYEENRKFDKRVEEALAG